MYVYWILFILLVAGGSLYLGIITPEPKSKAKKRKIIKAIIFIVIGFVCGVIAKVLEHIHNLTF